MNNKNKQFQKLQNVLQILKVIFALLYARRMARANLRASSRNINKYNTIVGPCRND
jgi:hypothetical protein